MIGSIIFLCTVALLAGIVLGLLLGQKTESAASVPLLVLTVGLMIIAYESVEPTFQASDSHETEGVQ